MNDSRKPGQDDNWTPEQMAQGDTYDYSRSVARNKNLGLYTSHLLDLTCGQLYLRLQPTFTYRHYDYDGSSLSATFSAMQGDADRSLLDSLYSLDSQSAVRRALINSCKKQTLNKGDIFTGNVAAAATVKFKNSSDHLSLSANISGNTTKDDNFNRYDIRLGNPNLRNQQTYELRGLVRKTDRERQTMKSLRLEYSTTANTRAMGYSYDAATGQRTYRAENVDGNWNTAATVGYNTPLGKSRITLSSNTRAEYRNSVDLIGEAVSGSDYAPARSSVHTTSLSENLRLNYKIGGSSSVGLKGKFAWLGTDGNVKTPVPPYEKARSAMRNGQS